MSICTYRYGCRPPVEELPYIVDQLRKAHRYRNMLTEVERGRRWLMPPRCPCGEARQREDETLPHWRCTCGACKAAQKEPDENKRAALHCGSGDATWQFAAAVYAAHGNAVAGAWIRRLRAECGLYSGTYLAVEASIHSQRGAKARPGTGKPSEPHFRRFSWRGRLGSQLLKRQDEYLSVAAAQRCADRRLRIFPDPLPDSRGTKPGSRRAGLRRAIWVRIGSRGPGGREPVWAKLDVTMHRPLPPDGCITWAYLLVDQVGPVATAPDGTPRIHDLRWSVLLTVDTRSAAGTRLRDACPERTGTIAIDLGWRVRPDGLRVGYWLDDRGNHGELVVPEDIRGQLWHARDLISIRRDNANQMRDDLVAWLAAQPPDALPEQFMRETLTLAQWKSANRLAWLCWRWRDHRFPADASIWPVIEAWLKQDRHLHQWEANETDKVLARRNEIYRCWSADFARRGRRVVFEDMNLPDLHGRAGLDDDATDGEKIRADRASSNRHIAAPGMFRSAVENACRARGTEIVKVDPAWTTIICRDCGCAEPWDAAPQINHQCAACGKIWDQEWNACRALLDRASGKVTPVSPTPLAGGFSKRQQRFRAAKAGLGYGRRHGNGGCSQRGLESSEITSFSTSGVERPAHGDEA